MTLAIVLVLVGCVLLAWGADRFIVGASAIAKNLGIPALIVGVTLVGFGTSLPEMLVAVLASWKGQTALAMGSALGSNIINITLVLGLAAIIRPLLVHSRLLRRELPMLIVTLLVAYFFVLDDRLDRINGVMLFAGFVLLLLWLLWQAYKAQTLHGKGEVDPMIVEYEAHMPAISTIRAIVWVVIGGVLLLVSSEMLVTGATHIATMLGISDLVIGLTVVAVGTSLPELAASVTGAIKGEHDIAIGNVVGSNMFNILAVLAMPGLIHPSVVPKMLLIRDFPVALGLTLVLFVMAFGYRKPGRINRLEGCCLLLLFIGYLVLLYFERAY